MADEFDLFRTGRRYRFVGGDNPSWVPQEESIGSAGLISPNAWTIGDYANLHDGAASVWIDSTGITIVNGALTFEDDYGTTVLDGGGFGPPWASFIANGVYNGDFAAGTTNDITAATLVGSASTLADYAASLSADLPYWIIYAESGAGTLKRVADSTAQGGYALEWDGTEDAVIVQDIPCVPGNRYVIGASWRFTNSTSSFKWTISPSFRDADHANIDASTAYNNTVSATQSTYQKEKLAATIEAPANAAYLRIYFRIERVSGAPNVKLNLLLTERIAPRLNNTSTSGTFPPIPALGDKFWRSDLGLEFFYDGTRWMCTCVHDSPVAQVGLAALPISATTAAVHRLVNPGSHQSLDIYVEEVQTTFYVAGGTALSGSHKWIANFDKVDTANAATSMHAININSGSSSVWRLDTGTPASPVVANATYYSFAVTWTKTGTPGNLYIMMNMRYRYIAT